MKLLITVVSDRFFLSHFLDRALSAQRAGYQVVVVAPETEFAEQIRGHRFIFHPINLDRHNVNPVLELRSILELSKIYRDQRPALVWQIGIKPIVLGTLAVILGSPGTKIVNAPVGLGYVFAGEDRKARLVRPLLKKALQQLLNPKGSMVVFENQEDLREMERIGALRRTGGIVIKGAGVSLTEFPPLPEPAAIDPTILLAARMIEEKGIRVYVEAAQILKKRGHNFRFLLAGGVDHQHSSAISEEVLRSWNNSGIIQWLGDQRNMSAIIGHSHIFCLPTWHREGIPKVLLEAMATGRAIITTDVVGCRELIQHKKNGWLISPKDPVALANAIEYLVAKPEQRARLAKSARREVEREYASEIICRQTLQVFKSLAPIPSRVKWSK